MNWLCAIPLPPEEVPIAERWMRAAQGSEVRPRRPPPTTSPAHHETAKCLVLRTLRWISIETPRKSTSSLGLHLTPFPRTTPFQIMRTELGGRHQNMVLGWAPARGLEQRVSANQPPLDQTGGLAAGMQSIWEENLRLQLSLGETEGGRRREHAPRLTHPQVHSCYRWKGRKPGLDPRVDKRVHNGWSALLGFQGSL